METFLIFAAIVALALAGVIVSAMWSRKPRPPLRMQHEADILGDDDEVLDALEPEPASPIDRSAPILDLEPIEPDRTGLKTITHDAPTAPKAARREDIDKR